MKNLNFFCLLATLLAIFFIGCSRSDNPISSSGALVEKPGYDALPVVVTDRATDGSVLGGMGTLGLFQLHLDPSALSGELTSLRRSSLTDTVEVVDITNFLMMAPCTNCAKIKSVSLDADSHLVVAIGIKHPFPAGDPFKPITGRNRADLHVFNVEGIVVSNAPGTAFSNLGQTIAGLSLLNADGYTNYLDSPLDEIFPTDATIHPYVLHFDDYSAGNFDAANTMGFGSVTDPPPTGNLVMSMGCDYNYQDYIFNLDGSFDFIYAVGCTYGISAASKSERFTPEYRVPQHNKKAASEVSLEIVSNGLKGLDSSTSAQVEVHVVDMSHGVAVGEALNEMLADSSVDEIKVDVPGVMLAPITIDGGSSVSGTGHSSSDPLIYQGTITNTASADEGTYIGLIKVKDTYLPGQNGSPLLNGMDGIKRVDPLLNPLTGLFSISEFATYQTFSIDVGPAKSLVLTVPNGGEIWDGLTHHDITWTASPSIPFIDLYYSKDDFIADSHLIIDNYANTGTFDWNVPNDPSTTVKVKIVETGGTLEDKSDDYFEIVASGCNFGPTGFTLASSYTPSGRWTYMGVMVTQQDPVQRIIMQGSGDPGNHILYIHNASNPAGAAAASYDTGDLIYCNNNKAFWIDAVSEPGIDRILYNNFGTGSPTAGYQLKSIDWDGSTFSNPQTLPKNGSIWSLCVTREGDLISHDAFTVAPNFFRRDKSNNYALTTLFTLQQTTCQFGQVGYIKDIAYDWKLDAIVLFCRNTDVSNGGQVFVLSMTGALLYQDLDVFGGPLISYNASVDVDIKDPTCRIVVYAGDDLHAGPYYIGRYSWDFIEKKANTYSGLTYGPGRGELCADGTLWAGWENGTGVSKFNIPPDW